MKFRELIFSHFCWKTKWNKLFQMQSDILSKFSPIDMTFWYLCVIMKMNSLSWLTLSSRVISFSKILHFGQSTFINCDFIRKRVNSKRKSLIFNQKLIALLVYFLTNYILPKLKKITKENKNNNWRVILTLLDLFNFSIKFRFFNSIFVWWKIEVFFSWSFFE